MNNKQCEATWDDGQSSCTKEAAGNRKVCQAHASQWRRNGCYTALRVKKDAVPMTEAAAKEKAQLVLQTKWLTTLAQLKAQAKDAGLDAQLRHCIRLTFEDASNDAMKDAVVDASNDAMKDAVVDAPEDALKDEMEDAPDASITEEATEDAIVDATPEPNTYPPLEEEEEPEVVQPTKPSKWPPAPQNGAKSPTVRRPKNFMGRSKLRPGVDPNLKSTRSQQVEKVNLNQQGENGNI